MDTKGIDNLAVLLQNLEPKQQAHNYVFASFALNQDHLLPHCISFFKEEEGFTYIVEKKIAMMHQIPFDQEWAWISLKVHSSLSAVGLTAAISTALTEHQISCNVVAAYYHDHLFVPKDKAELAVTVLKSLRKT